MERIKIEFNNFDEAMDAHKEIFTMLKEKGFVFLSEVFPGGSYYGWNSLRDMQVEQDYCGNWFIRMPELELIEPGMVEDYMKKEND